MCGRYRLSRRKQIIEEHFDTVSDEPDWTPRYNIAPTVIRQNPKEPRRELSVMRWGLIPSWAKDMSGAAMMIDSRSETAATKPAFRDPLQDYVNVTLGFRPVYVWDVLQTEGKEQPQLDSKVKGDVGSSLGRLVNFTIQ
jgi:hypothetical protein